MRWTLKPFSAARAAGISRELGLYRIVAGVLVARGVADADEARSFINPSLEHDWSDPEAIIGMRRVADRLEKAIRGNKSLVIFGDYDVDGITAAALMHNILVALGTQPHVILPLREGEGYGLSEAAIKRILALNPEVVLTVDTGIAAGDEIAFLEKLGIEVLVTDHHEAPDVPPLSVPAADPKLDPKSTQGILAGAGVALKLAALLCDRFGRPDLWKSQLDLAALGTLADCMPLYGENRALVSAGVKTIKTHARPGIAAVQEVSGKVDMMTSSEALVYGLIPRLNAAGRVSDPMIAFDLLQEPEPERALQLAMKLENLNIERKELEAALMSKAVRQIEPFNTERRSVVVGGERWHEGVRGIVASRLVGEYRVPSLVFTFENGLGVGSGRTVGSVNLYAAVNELSDLLIRFGGHEAAIGVTIEQDRLGEFAERLEAIMQELPVECLQTTDSIDCQIGFEHLSLEAVEELSVLEPYGKGNPEPRFLTTGLLLKAPAFIGADGKHLSLQLSDGVREFAAIWFNAPYHCVEDLPSLADVIYRVHLDEWRGRRKIKLLISDILTDCTIAQEERSIAGLDRKDRLEQLLLLGNRDEINRELANIMQGAEVTLRAAQLKCLEHLDEGKFTLAVMATGRGKSLIFHTHAAKQALLHGKPSLFIYPLRSLISDQEFFLVGVLESIGLSCASLTGSTPQNERERIALGIAEGTLQVVLTTPEYVLANAHRHTFWRDFGFVVIDEAHHIATSGEEFRPDYTRLERVRALAPDATFLGLTATSDKPTTDAIVKSLGIESIVVDTSKRPNLKLNDKRNTIDRDGELTAIVAQSSKALVYVSSRVATIELCKELRKKLPGKAHRIAFYNAALTAGDRLTIEDAFRTGKLDYLLATSAFGEGVNIPDVRDVVLYNLPYSIIDFNQMAGRVGRDGKEAFVHILARQDDSKRLLHLLATDELTTQGEGQEKVAENERQASIRQLKLFADWLFETSPDGLLSVIQKPLTPLEEQHDT